MSGRLSKLVSMQLTQFEDLHCEFFFLQKGVIQPHVPTQSFEDQGTFVCLAVFLKPV